MMSEQPGVMKAMPRYKSHKEVSALKITKVMTGGHLAFVGDYAVLHVGEGFFGKHHPQPGGYYVIYDDGYVSYSPAKAFEEGYTMLDPEARKPDLPCEDSQMDLLAQRAARLRATGGVTKANPYFPQIPCAREGCDKEAREAWHFCSDECRIEYQGVTAKSEKQPS